MEGETRVRFLVHALEITALIFACIATVLIMAYVVLILEIVVS